MLVPLAVVFVAYAWIVPDGLGEATRSVAVATAWALTLIVTLLVTLLVLILVTAARRGTAAARQVAGSPGTWLAVAVVAYLVLLTAVSGRMAPLPVFDALDRHWQGKVLDLVWLAVLFGMLHRWARAEAGLRLSITPGSARPALLTIAVVFGGFVGLTALAVALDPSAATAVGAEQVAYNATIPNLTEELIWRAAMLAVLDRAFGTPWVVLGAPVGWGVVLTSVVFGAGHGLLVDLDGVWGFNVAGGLFATVMGLALGWIWARTGSVWPAFLLHCAPELGVDVGMLVAG
ncbi:CPBP family intramembrane glutamic endopeptidase [Micromonospora craniellae]|uniref:CPBP family intramembrane glutamic endopeptidase n=1 Tax=Micromonospora craniellae TaxID=2294034 RepID=UPI0013142A64|nr:CPBP family intramembrane glutamic endopeptidase [Micromonospora craniellae]QOC91554.1 CPBP family intramembrane metalloprotease [Micromonospora craniellae]